MKQLISYLLTIILWIISVILAISNSFPWLLIFLIALHFVELIVIGFRTGRLNGTTAIKSILMCMIFGFFWWLPLKKLMSEDELKEQDFIEDGQEPWREAF